MEWSLRWHSGVEQWQIMGLSRIQALFLFHAFSATVQG